MADISLGEQGLEATHARRNPLHRPRRRARRRGRSPHPLAPGVFGSGIALYFALTVEPPVWLGPAMALAGGLAAFAFRGHFARRSACLCLAIAAAGFALIAETTRERAAPMLERRLGPVAVTGRVIDIDTMERGWRIIIAPDALPGLDPAQQPRKLRIHITAASDLLSPGDRTSLKAMLYPIPARRCLVPTICSASSISRRSAGSATAMAARGGWPRMKGRVAVGGKGCWRCAPR